MKNNMESINELAERIKVPPYESFPDIELYMDQVLDFLSRSHTSLRHDDRLSSAMVNNYIKAELLPRARGKKYSHEHLAHLSVILRLKHVLSVKDIGELLYAFRQDKSDEEFFNSFRNMVEENANEIADLVRHTDAQLPDIAMRLALISYLAKVSCEYLIDLINDVEDD